MTSPSMPSLLFFFVTTYFLMGFVWSASSVCPLQSDVFISYLRNQCSPSISPCLPIEVDGNFVDQALTSRQRKTFISVLFYASWCPYSHGLRPKFDILSSMFPEIEHLAVEQSNVLPSTFSRYGIHSLPAIVIANQSLLERYHGPKDLLSIVQFYQETTGFEPVQYPGEKEPIRSRDAQNYIMQSWNWLSANEIVIREPYLAFAVLFLCLRVLLAIFPSVLSRLKAFCLSYVPHLNLEIFGETSQLFGRALHMIDVRRIWTKLRLCKTRNFHQGAKSARVWASSLASVSLGESSFGRSSTSS